MLRPTCHAPLTVLAPMHTPPPMMSLVLTCCHMNALALAGPPSIFPTSSAYRLFCFISFLLQCTPPPMMSLVLTCCHMNALVLAGPPSIFPTSSAYRLFCFISFLLQTP